MMTLAALVTLVMLFRQGVRPPVAIGPYWGVDAASHSRLCKYKLHALVATPVDVDTVFALPETATKSVSQIFNIWFIMWGSC